MPGRAATKAAAVALVPFGLIGLAAEPSQLLWSVLLGAAAAGGVHLWNLKRAVGGSTSSVLCDSVVLAGVATVAVCAVLIGVVVGTAGATVIIVLVMTWALWRWIRRTSRPAPAIRDKQLVREIEPNRDVFGLYLADAATSAVDLSVAELCLAWRRSYLLVASAYGTGHDEVVSWRRQLLDELEQRDRVGFGRWIDTGARAASDPAPHLRAERWVIPSWRR